MDKSPSTGNGDGGDLSSQQPSEENIELLILLGYICFMWIAAILYDFYNRCRSRITAYRYYKKFLSMDYFMDIVFAPLFFPLKLLDFLYKVLLYIFRLLLSFCTRSGNTSQILYDEHAPINMWKMCPLCCYCSSSYFLYNFYKPFSKKLRVEDQHDNQESVAYSASVINMSEEMEDKQREVSSSMSKITSNYPTTIEASRVPITMQTLYFPKQ